MENALTKDDLKTLDELLSSTFNSILRIEERSLNNRLTEGLSIAELHTICAVGLHEANPMKVIANRLGITLATLTVMINKLEKRSYVKRERSETDRRQVLVALTAKAQGHACPRCFSQEDGGKRSCRSHPRRRRGVRKSSRKDQGILRCRI